MKHIQLLYSHEYTLTLWIEGLTPETLWQHLSDRFVRIYHEPSSDVKDVPLRDLARNSFLYDQRGWCMAEMEWSSSRSTTLANHRADVIEAAVGEERKLYRAKAATEPGKFKELMNKLVFTHRPDLEFVFQLQEQVFMEKVTNCKELLLRGVPADQAVALAQSLSHYRSLKKIELHQWECSKSEADMLGEARLAESPVVVSDSYSPSSRIVPLCESWGLVQKQHHSVLREQ